MFEILEIVSGGSLDYTSTYNTSEKCSLENDHLWDVLRAGESEDQASPCALCHSLSFQTVLSSFCPTAGCFMVLKEAPDSVIRVINPLLY